MIAYKGFDKDLKCRGFQYEVGKEYEEEKAELCNSGFHACLYPLDVFNYYPPANSRYCVVELDGVSDEKSNDDSKVCAKKIKIVREITIAELTAAAVDFVMDKVEKDTAASNTGDQSSASNTGNQSSASNTGNQSSASNTGNQSSASNTGDQSSASNTGDQSSASNTGNQSSASNTGNQSSASNTGDQSSASNTGYQSSASNTGDQSSASNTGNRSSASNTGDQSSASNTGYQSSASNTGNQSSASNTGNRSSASVSGKDSVAIVTGYQSKAKACIGSAICVVERGEWNGSTYPLIAIKSAIIDGEILKADTFYTLKNGEFVEADNND